LKRTRLAVMIGAACICIGASFAAGTAVASTDTDPLITLSYLREVAMPELKEQIITSIQSNPAPAPSAASANSYTVIELSAGQTVTSNSVCEFIVRPGSKVVCLSPFEDQGIADITLGNEYLNGEEIAINSYCLIPRGADGRGFTVQSEKAYIMIRGDYTIG